MGERLCKCGKPSHPVYGSECEDCFASRFSGTGLVAGGQQGEKRWIDRKNGDQFLGHNGKCENFHGVKADTSF